MNAFGFGYGVVCCGIGVFNFILSLLHYDDDDDDDDYAFDLVEAAAPSYSL